MSQSADEDSVNLKNRLQVLTFLASAVTQFITAALRAINRWKLLAPLTTHDSKLANEFLQSQRLLYEQFPQVKDGELEATWELATSDSAFQAVSALSRSCAKCKMPNTVDLGCHQICSKCLDLSLKLEISQRGHLKLFTCPKKDCDTHILPSALAAAVGQKQFKKLQREKVSAEHRPYQCSMCFRTGSNSDVYDLDCDCNLCIICVGECIDKGGVCMCGKPLPEEVKSYSLQWKAMCGRCLVEKVVKGHFVRMQCMGHWMCCHCAVEEVMETTPICPTCHDPLPPHVTAGIQFELAHATCVICHHQCAVAETVETKCACVVCVNCASQQEAATQCPVCLDFTLTYAGLEKITQLHRRNNFLRR